MQTNEQKRAAAEHTARERARLAAELAPLLERCPAGVVNGSYQRVLDWKAAHKKAKAPVKNQRAMPTDLQTSINTMRGLNGRAR